MQPHHWFKRGRQAGESLDRWARGGPAALGEDMWKALSLRGRQSVEERGASGPDGPPAPVKAQEGEVVGGPHHGVELNRSPIRAN